MSSAFTATELLTTFGPTVLGSLLGGASGGSAQGGTQTVNKDPWLPAQDWMKQNLSTGQNLQNYYQTNPFNSQQQSAYGNLASGGDYMNRLVPSLLQQFSQPTGFDRSHPNARPSPLNFSAPDVNPYFAKAFGGQMQPSGGEQPQAQPKAPFMFFANDAEHPSSGGPFTAPMYQSAPQRADMNMTQNPFGNGGIQPMAQAAQPNIQQMVNDAMAQRQSQYMPPDINIGNGGGG